MWGKKIFRKTELHRINLSFNTFVLALRIEIAHEENFPVLQSCVAHRLNLFFGGFYNFRHRLVAGKLIKLQAATVQRPLWEILGDFEGIGRVGMAKDEVVNVLKWSEKKKNFNGLPLHIRLTQPLYLH